MPLNSFVFQTYWNTVWNTSIIPDVGKSRTFNTPRQHKRTSNFYDPLDWRTTEMLLEEGGSRCCFHVLLGNVAILITSGLLWCLFEKLDIFIFVNITLSRTSLQIHIQWNFKLSALIKLNLLWTVWYSVALSYSAYSLPATGLLNVSIILHKLSNENEYYLTLQIMLNYHWQRIGWRRARIFLQLQYVLCKNT